MSLRPSVPVRQKRRTPLDRAILASVVAMVGMNFFVLAQQLQASPLLATAGGAIGTSLV